MESSILKNRNQTCPAAGLNRTSKTSKGCWGMRGRITELYSFRKYRPCVGRFSSGNIVIILIATASKIMIASHKWTLSLRWEGIYVEKSLEATTPPYAGEMVPNIVSLELHLITHAYGRLSENYYAYGRMKVNNRLSASATCNLFWVWM